MEEIISKEEFEELMKTEGEVRGVAFQTETNFVLEKKGKDVLKKLEDEMARLGHPYSNIKAMEFYPLGLLIVALTIIKKLLNFTDEDFQEMGKFEAKSSLIIRISMKYFVSLDRIVKEVPKMWRKYYSIGDFQITGLNKEKKEAVMKIENFDLHPILCQVFIGYFTSLIKMITKSDQITCEKTECSSENSECHQFYIKW